MILISHRGNLFGKKPKLENKPSYILEAIKNGFNVEVDVRFKKGNFYLGHDRPETKISYKFLENKKIWCHAKNPDAIFKLSQIKAHYFWHQEDDYTITSKGVIWVYPGKKLIENSICVLPKKIGYIPKKCIGICSDKIALFKKNI
tara:strand:+ start:1295 stop:1729 length:435 start_codon:yes stop_codon:yes gene_type:complete